MADSLNAALASMIRSIPRAMAVALFGALAGPACLLTFYARDPAVSFGTDRELPAFATGFYGVERSGRDTFVWMGDHARLTLSGLDRRSTWTCALRFRGARPPSVPQPDLQAAVDGVRAGTWRATNEFQDVEVAVSPAPGRLGLVLELTAAPTFAPGGTDPRRLGVQIDEIACRPAAAVLPPPRAIGAAALAGAALGGAFVLTGTPVGGAVVACLFVAAGQAIPLLRWGALYGRYPAVLAQLAGWIGLLTVVGVKGIEAVGGRSLRNTARFVVLFSAGALYLELAALLHPAKPVVDAVFHAHRFDAVLAGHFYFTQLSTSATPFPYAIGLYLFAAPWALVVRDHVALLRTVVAASEVLAGTLLYAAIVRTWGDRLAGAMAVALFGVVPVSFAILGNANLTNAFGQAVSVATVSAVTVWPERVPRPWPFIVLTLAATLGLMSHVSTLVLLTPILVVVAALYWWVGGSGLRRTARAVALATGVAVVLATVLYWGHFGHVYATQFARLRGSFASMGPGVQALPPAPGRRLRPTLPLGDRVFGAFDQTVANLGWPILVLAVAGAWRFARDRARDGLTLAVWAWGGICVVFVAFSVLSPSVQRYQQDAWEFIGRVEHATMPAVVILAARGAAWAWRGGSVARLASGLLLAAALTEGLWAWAAWLQ
jgi:hypothetical protein